MEDIYDELLKNTSLQVLTDTGYQDFDGLLISSNDKLINIKISSGKHIQCTPDHKIFINITDFVLAKQLVVGDYVQTIDGTEKISYISSENLSIKKKTYDLLEVSNGHKWYINQILSHQCVFLDEFAFVPSSIANEFMQSVYPVITAGTKTKIIIVSTPNGMNLFYKIWTDAINKRNSYTPYEVHWSQVPGRDDAWEEETRKNIGDHNFEQEFNTTFLGSTNTLISGTKLQQLTFSDPITQHDDTKIYEYPIKGDDDGIKDHLYCISVDVSEGRNMDASSFSVFDISSTPYKQVATYCNSNISPILFPTIIYNAARLYNDAYILVEINNNPQVADIIHQDLEYENLFKIMTGNKKPQQLCGGFGRGVQMGLKMSPAVKRIGCSNLKTLIEGNKLQICDFETVSELTTFVANKTSFAAESDAHDDLAMTLVIFAWVTTQKYFRDIVAHDIRKQIQLESLNQVDDESLPAPIIEDGFANEFDVIDGDVWEKADSGEVYAGFFRELMRN